MTYERGCRIRFTITYISSSYDKLLRSGVEILAPRGSQLRREFQSYRCQHSSTHAFCRRPPRHHLRASPPEALPFSGQIGLAPFRNLFWTFWWYLFRTGWINNNNANAKINYGGRRQLPFSLRITLLSFRDCNLCHIPLEIRGIAGWRLPPKIIVQ